MEDSLRLRGLSHSLGLNQTLFSTGASGTPHGILKGRILNLGVIFSPVNLEGVVMLGTKVTEI